MPIISITFLLIASSAAYPQAQPPRTVPRRPRPTTAQRQPYRQPRPARSPARTRLQTLRLLQQQINTWRLQARQIRPNLSQENLQQEPDITELETIARTYPGQIASMLLKQMNRTAILWEKIYVGRALLAMLDRADQDQLDRNTRLLIRAFQAAPDLLRALPAPAVKFPLPTTDKPQLSTTPGPKDQPPPELSEQHLIALRRAKLDAQQRNAQDRQIALINQALIRFQQEFATLIVRSSSPAAHQVVIEKLSRQLIDKDADFLQTIEVLSRANFSRLDPRQLRAMRTTIASLTRRFAGPRSYNVYTQVTLHQDRRSDFDQTELDFTQAANTLLTHLDDQLQPDRPTPGPDQLETTPRPASPKQAKPSSKNKPYKSARPREMRQIILAILRYGQEEDEWPDKLRDLEDYFPSRSRAYFDDYRYKGPPGKPGKKDSQAAILFEKIPSRPDGEFVGFADGRVEFIRNR